MVLGDAKSCTALGSKIYFAGSNGQINKLISIAQQHRLLLGPMCFVRLPGLYTRLLCIEENLYKAFFDYTQHILHMLLCILRVIYVNIVSHSLKVALHRITFFSFFYLLALPTLFEISQD